MKAKDSILKRVLFIGNEIPESLLKDDRPKFIVLGTPQEVIDEIDSADENQSAFDDDGCMKKFNS